MLKHFTIAYLDARERSQGTYTLYTDKQCKKIPVLTLTVSGKSLACRLGQSSILNFLSHCCPVNLLGRDQIHKLGIKLISTQEGPESSYSMSKILAPLQYGQIDFLPSVFE